MAFEVNQKPDHHRADIIRLQAENFHSHTNADNLVIIKLDGYQLVTRKDEFKPGDLAVFIQPDSVVPQTGSFKFIWEKYVGLDGTVPEKRRRITVRKFRGEWSEGLLMPLTDDLIGNEYAPLNEGTDVSDLIGVTHYVPEETNTGGDSVPAPRKKARRPKTFKGWIKYIYRILFQRPEPEIILDYPVYEINSVKRRNPFEDGERVVVTEKIHGSNARFVFVDGTMYAGSHYQWKHPSSSNVFTRALTENPWIERWCRYNEGYVLYGEITPTQKNFNYAPVGKSPVQFFVFDILTPDGQWCADFHPLWRYLKGPLEVTVPELYRGPFREDLLFESNVGGQSLVRGASHIREGVVIKAEYGPRKVVKAVSNAYLEKDAKQ